MPTVANRDLGISILAADQHRAESLLAELATDLRRVPVDGPTRALHLRALSLKGAVMRWSEEQPEEPARRAVLDELLAMQTEARGHATLTKPSAGLSGDGNARR